MEQLKVLLPHKTLLLAVNPKLCDPADFLDIAQRIRKIAPEIDVKVLLPHHLTGIPSEALKNPTLLVILGGHQAFSLARGAVVGSRQLSKLHQDEMFHLGGVRTPVTAKYEIGMYLDPQLWGEFVLLKPLPLFMTSKGNGIQVFRTGRLSGMTAADFPRSHLVHSAPMLIQQFVDTGVYPQKYRALTLLGSVLYISWVENTTPRPDLSASDREFESGKFHNSGEAGSKREFGQYPEVYKFAQRVASAFPTIPLLGCDIVKDVHTGKLFALEVNAGGNVWHFSSPYLAKVRARFPDEEKLRHTQYGAFDVAARALIRATRGMAV